MPAEEGNLISSGASLIRAVSNGDAETVRTLLAEGAYVDQMGRGGQTALMVAAIFCHVDIARLLLAAGADERLQDNLGLTAKAWAERRGSAEVVELLSNDSPHEELPSRRQASQVSPEVITDGEKNAVERDTSLQQLALRMTRGRPGSKALPQQREEEDIPTSLPEPGVGRDNPLEVVYESSSTKEATQVHVRDSRQASDAETKTPREPDSVRFMKFHKQIMAAQQRRQAEQERSNTDDVPRSLSERGAGQMDSPPGASGSSPTATRPEMEGPPRTSASEPTTATQEDDPYLLERETVATWSPTASTPSSEPEPPSSTDAALLSEPGAVASWSPTDATPLSEPEPPSSTDAALLSEPGAVATWSPTDSTPSSEPEPPSSTDAALLSEPGAAASWSPTDATPLSEREVSSESAILSEWEAIASTFSTDATLLSEGDLVDTPSSRDVTLSSEPETLATASSTGASLLSEQGAVATWSSTDAPPLSEQEPTPLSDAPPLSEQEPVATPSSTDASLLSEQGAVATWSSTDAPPLSAQEATPSSDASLLSEQEPTPLSDASLLSEQEPTPLSDASLLSEQGAVATPSSTDAPPLSEQQAPSSDASLLSEQGVVATWSSTDAPPLSEQLAPSSDASLLSAPEAVGTPSSTEAASRQAEVPRPTAKQLAGIATTIEHLKIREESRQLVESKIPAKFAGPKAAAMELDHHDPSTTLPRLHAELFTPIATLGPKPNPLLTPPPSKHCPKCNASYDDPLLAYCAFDATRLVSADDPLPSQPPPDDRLSPTLWALVALVGVLGAFLGYLIIDYRYTENLSSAPAAQIEPEIARKDLPVVGGDLSGMEVNVPEPEYPAQALSEGVSGTVTIRVQVNQKGRVIRARSSGGDRRLRAAAVEAAQKATFSPQKLAAQGRTVSGTITYTFAAPTESADPTGSPAAAETISPSESESASATGSAAGNEGEDYPVVGGPLVGAESNLPEPDYETARSSRVYGTITVTVRVNRAGKVISWRTSPGDSLLRAEALKAAKKATFSPEKLPGTGEVVGTITYNFKE